MGDVGMVTVTCPDCGAQRQRTRGRGVGPRSRCESCRTAASLRRAKERHPPSGCIDCGAERESERRGRCATCRAERKRQTTRRWQTVNPEKRRAYYEATREHQIERGRAYARANRDRARERGRAWHERNRDRARENGRAWRERNLDRAREIGRAWRVRNIDKRTAADHVRRATTAGVPIYEITPKDWRRLLAATACRYCHASDQMLTVDHVIPVSRGGSHSIGNVVMACDPCNRSKGAKLLSEWRLWKVDRPADDAASKASAYRRRRRHNEAIARQLIERTVERTPATG